jgi:putative drug exporter of the RND superfamily
MDARRPIVPRLIRWFAVPIIISWIALTVLVNIVAPQLEVVGERHAAPAQDQVFEARRPCFGKLKG